MTMTKPQEWGRYAYMALSTGTGLTLRETVTAALWATVWLARRAKVPDTVVVKELEALLRRVKGPPDAVDV